MADGEYVLPYSLEAMWNELDPIPRPAEVGAEDWEALTPGERVRALRYAEEDWPQLPAHVYGKLRSLPSWAFYGPEHGLPQEWFNAQGFLLPRFRPGGAQHEEFRGWRREHRLRQWIGTRLRERWARRWREVGGWLVVAGIAALVAAGTIVQVRLGRDLGDFAAGGWYLILLLAGLALTTIVTALARRYERPFLSWVADRIARRRLRARGRRA